MRVTGIFRVVAVYVPGLLKAGNYANFNSRHALGVKFVNLRNSVVK